MQQITGTGVAMIDKYTRFDPKKPETTQAASFHFFTEDLALNKDGSVKATWTKDGYIMVGKAQITIDLLPAKDVRSTPSHRCASRRRQCRPRPPRSARASTRRSRACWPSPTRPNPFPAPLGVNQQE